MFLFMIHLPLVEKTKALILNNFKTRKEINRNINIRIPTYTNLRKYSHRRKSKYVIAQIKPINENMNYETTDQNLTKLMNKFGENASN